MPRPKPGASVQCPPWRLLQVSAMLHTRGRPHTTLVPVAGSRMLADLQLSSPCSAILLLETRRMVFNTEGLAPDVPGLPVGEFVLRRRVIDAHLGGPSTCICELEWRALGDACRREEFLDQLLQEAGTTTSTSAAAHAAQDRAEPAELPAVQTRAVSRQKLPGPEAEVRAKPSLPPDALAEAEGRKTELPPPPAAPKQRERQQTRSGRPRSQARRPAPRPWPGVQHARASSPGRPQPAASFREQDQARMNRGARRPAHMRSPPRLGPPRNLLPFRDLQPPPPQRRDIHSRFLGEPFSHGRPFPLELEPYEVRPPHRWDSPPPLAGLWAPYAGPREVVPPEPRLDRRPYQGHPGSRLDMFRPSDIGMWNERQPPPLFRDNMHLPGLPFSGDLGPPFRGRGPLRGEGGNVRPASEPMWHQPLPYKDPYQDWHTSRPRERFPVDR